VRTMKAFGYSGAADSVAALRLRSAVKPGSENVFADCAQEAPLPCSRLGWGVYVVITPISITGSRARVEASVVWANRSDIFEVGVAPTGRSWLSGFSSEVFLVRAPDGRWKFEKIGRTAVG
ncbi:MAG: hypothetical protein ACRENC_12760, partial [Gemmatimonadaceae bacterium]